MVLATLLRFISALADAAGIATLYHDEGNWGHSIMKQWQSSWTEQVAKDSLASFCAAYQISQIGLIKFNCEGAEFPVLLNTPIDLLSNVRRMLVEYHLDLVQYKRETITERLHCAGFVTTIQEEGRQRGFIIATRR